MHEARVEPVLGAADPCGAAALRVVFSCPLRIIRCNFFGIFSVRRRGGSLGAARRSSRPANGLIRRLVVRPRKCQGVRCTVGQLVRVAGDVSVMLERVTPRKSLRWRRQLAGRDA